MGVYLPASGTLGCVVWPGTGIAGYQGVLPDFYPPHVTVGLLVHATLLLLLRAVPLLLHPSSRGLFLLPVCTNVVSSNPRSLDFHTA